VCPFQKIFLWSRYLVKRRTGIEIALRKKGNPISKVHSAIGPALHLLLIIAGQDLAEKYNFIYNPVYHPQEQKNIPY
jgi:hypothetical protein